MGDRGSGEIGLIRNPLYCASIYPVLFVGLVDFYLIWDRRQPKLEWRRGSPQAFRYGRTRAVSAARRGWIDFACLLDTPL
jgi:hypothetical protein